MDNTSQEEGKASLTQPLSQQHSSWKSRNLCAFTTQLLRRALRKGPHGGGGKLSIRENLTVNSHHLVVIAISELVRTPFKPSVRRKKPITRGVCILEFSQGT